MSRVAKKPIVLPAGVDAEITDQLLTIKSSRGKLQQVISPAVKVTQADRHLRFEPTNNDHADAIAGALRALADRMVQGITKGFECKLTLVGVGYRAQVQGKKLTLSVGYSHPIVYPLPEGISVDTPTQTEITVKGIDHQKVGQVAAEIRAFRAPEPYKGKGVRYADEVIILKEAKKK